MGVYMVIPLVLSALLVCFGLVRLLKHPKGLNVLGILVVVALLLIGVFTFRTRFAMMLVGLLLLAGFIWGFIVLYKHPNGRVVLAIVGVGIPVLVGGLFFFSVRRVEVVADRGTTVLRPVQELPVPAAVWSAGLEAQFAAEPYSSVESAARALGRQLALEVRQVAGQEEGPIPVYLRKSMRSSEQNDPLERLWDKALAAVAQGMRETASDVTVHLEDEAEAGEVSEVYQLPAGAYAEAIVSLLSVRQERTVMGTGPAGTVSVLLRGPAGSEVSRSAEFVEKEWVGDFARFMNQQGRSFLVGRSRETAMDAFEAHQEAMQDAIAQVQAALGAYNVNGKEAQVLDWADIEQGGLVADRFVQSLQTTTGRVYREAVLLDVSADRMWRLRQKVMGQWRGQRRTWAAMAVSLAGMLAVIVAVYVFLNAATKGYYTWALRIGMVVLALGLGCLVWLVW